MVHEGLQSRGLEPALEVEAARTLAQRLQQPIEGSLAQTAVGGGAFVGRRELTEAGIELEVPEMADGGDHARRLLVRGGREDQGIADEFHPVAQLFEAHGGGLDGASEVLPDATEVFPRERAEALRRLLPAEAHRQIVECHPPVPPINPVGQPAARAAQPRHPRQRQRLQEGDHRAGQVIEGCFHR